MINNEQISAVITQFIRVITPLCRRYRVDVADATQEAWIHALQVKQQYTFANDTQLTSAIWVRLRQRLIWDIQAARYPLTVKRQGSVSRHYNMTAKMSATTLYHDVDVFAGDTENPEQLVLCKRDAQAKSDLVAHTQKVVEGFFDVDLAQAVELVLLQGYTARAAAAAKQRSVSSVRHACAKTIHSLRKNAGEQFPDILR